MNWRTPPRRLAFRTPVIGAGADVGRQPGLGLTQKADDVLFGKALLYVQSAWFWGVGLQIASLLKAGGRRIPGMSPGRIGPGSTVPRSSPCSAGQPVGAAASSDPCRHARAERRPASTGTSTSGSKMSPERNSFIGRDYMGAVRTVDVSRLIGIPALTATPATTSARPSNAARLGYRSRSKDDPGCRR